MKRKFLQNEAGRSLIEYSLILGVVLIMFVGMASIGPVFTGRVNTLTDQLTGAKAAPKLSPVETITADFLKRIQAFYDKNGHWPRTWGDFRFTDLGLNPADWTQPVEGILWNPHGNEIGLADQAGDNLQVYVKDLKGNLLHLYDGWNIWCRAGHCYYHTVAPENEVDLSTLIVKYGGISGATYSANSARAASRLSRQAPRSQNARFQTSWATARKVRASPGCLRSAPAPICCRQWDRRGGR